jgi:hypothetical protein
VLPGAKSPRPDDARRRSNPDIASVREVHISDDMFACGIREEQLSTGPTVRMYSPEKSLADAFHFQSHVGRDIGIEGIRQYLGRRNPDLRALVLSAKLCRVSEEIRPFIEALI